jgi:hypothetical protein
VSLGPGLVPAAVAERAAPRDRTDAGPDGVRDHRRSVRVTRATSFSAGTSAAVSSSRGPRFERVPLLGAPGTSEEVPKLFSERIEPTVVPATAPELFGATADDSPPPRGAASLRARSTGSSYTTPDGLSASGSLGSV